MWILISAYEIKISIQYVAWRRKLKHTESMRTGDRLGSTPVWGSRACPGCRCGCSQLLSWRQLCWGSGASAPCHGLSTGPTPPAGGTEWSPERCCHYEWTAPPGIPAAPAKTNKVKSDGGPAAGRTEDDWVLLQGSYWRQADVVVRVLWVPASGCPPRVLILWRQPAGIRDICSPPSGVLSGRDNTTDTQLPKNNEKK